MSDSTATDPDPYDGVSDRFSRAFGHAFMAWAAIEQWLFYWFLDITETDIRVGRAIYYSPNGFGGRANMMLAVMPVAKIEADTAAFLKAAINKANNFSRFRNHLGHGEPSVDIFMDEQDRLKIEMRLTNGRHEFPASIEKSTTVEKLEFATKQFGALSKAIMQARIKRDASGPKTLSEFRELVLALPNSEEWDKAIRSPQGS